MRTVASLMICLLITFIFSGCARVAADKSSEAVGSGSQKASVAVPQLLPEMAEWLARNRLAVSAGLGNLDYEGAFAQGAIIAYGEGTPLADASGPGQKRLTALRAAEVVAQRNLAAFCAQHAVDGEIRFNTYTVRLEAFLKGAVTVLKEYDPEQKRAIVLMKLDLQGAKGFPGS